jgi:hypothetical protein
MRKVLLLAVVAIGALLSGAGQAIAFNPDTLVTVGSPPGPFSENKQNEPAVAIDASRPTVLVAGANDEIDMEACNAAADNDCPFTPGIGVSGVYFSFDSGTTWKQPTYTGLTARNCLGAPGPGDAPCAPTTGPIGTLPWYAENGLVSDGDPAVAFGPKPTPGGGFSFAGGGRLYYANLTSNLGATRSEQAFKGAEAIAVSRTDNVAAAAAGNKQAWCTGAAGCAPVIVSRQSSTTFSDKEQIWADNAQSSPFFGTVYVCWASFRSIASAPAPLHVAVSRDGGETWTERQIGSAANNPSKNPLDGCTVRTDSRGNAYLFGVGTVSSANHQSFELMSRSTNGGRTFSKPQPVAGPVQQPGQFDPVQGSSVIDGVAGARSDLAPAPSVDIANGAPTGADATDRIVLSFVSGTLAAPHVFFAESTNRGAQWTSPRAIETRGDRGLYAAPAISPNGRDVYVVYNAFTTPFRPTTATRRTLVGVVKHANAPTAPTRATGAFATLHRGAPGDPRGSSANALDSEFLGDYVYAAATRTYGAAVWNDARRASDCPAIDAFRQALQNGVAATPPAVQQRCALTFGNSDIFGGTFPDPTP